RRPRDSGTPLRAGNAGNRRRSRDHAPPVARRRLPALHGPRILRRRRGRDPMTAVRHTWFMVGRQLRNLMREPIWIALLLVQPMIWLLLYGQLFSRVPSLRGGASSYA